MHAVVVMRDEELWAVPVDIKYGNPEENTQDVATPEGPAREIVGLAGRMTDSIHPDGLEGLRAEALQGPFMADLYVRNATTFEDRTGPIDVVAMPMSYGAPFAQAAEVASAAIDEAAFNKRIGEVARDSEQLLRSGGLEAPDGGERSEITELVGALDAHRRQPTPERAGNLLDAAGATLGMLDDNALSSHPSFDRLATSVDAAERAGDALLKSRYSDLGLAPGVARDMEALARQHDAAMDVGEKPRPTAAVAGATMAAMSQSR